MIPVVVDASVAAKWVFQEPGSAAAARLRDPSYDLIAPDLMALEVANAIWKRVRSGRLPVDDGRRAVEELKAAPVRWRRDRPLVATAWKITARWNRSVYDCLYLALAALVHARLVTADRLFYDVMIGTELGGHMLWIEEIE